MSIGEELAEARRLAGLTVTEVSERTRIREATVHAIEGDDFGGCGGDFYARGFIRSIARAVGADPAPLVRDYDAAHRPPPAVTGSDRAEPFTFALPRVRRRRPLAVVLALALAIAVGLACYELVSAGGSGPRAAAGARGAGGAGNVVSGRRHAVSPPAPSPRSAPHGIAVRLRAAEDCWVEFTSPDGRFLFQSYVHAGQARQWDFNHQVDMTLGNPGGVTLTVNGRHPLPAGTSHPVTIRLSPRGNHGG